MAGGKLRLAVAAALQQRHGPCISSGGAAPGEITASSRKPRKRVGSARHHQEFDSIKTGWPTTIEVGMRAVARCARRRPKPLCGQ